MGCAFEAAREPPETKTKQLLSLNQKHHQQQLRDSSSIGKTNQYKATITTKSVECCNGYCQCYYIKCKQQVNEDIRIKDNYQQNHKTKSVQRTAAATTITSTVAIRANIEGPIQGVLTPSTQQKQQEQQEQTEHQGQKEEQNQQGPRIARLEANHWEEDAAANDQLKWQLGTKIRRAAIVDTATTTDYQTLDNYKNSLNSKNNKSNTKIHSKTPACSNLCYPYEQRPRRHLRRQQQQQQQPQNTEPGSEQLERQLEVRYVKQAATTTDIEWNSMASNYGTLHELLQQTRAALASLRAQTTRSTERKAKRQEKEEQKEIQQQQKQKKHLGTGWQLLTTHNTNDATANEAASPATMPAPSLANVSAGAAASTAAAFQYLGHYKYYSQSFSFYAASSVILILCYLTTTSTAAATTSETAALDKHPIHGIDWSKFDESSSDKEILDLLLEKKRYDKRLLPPVNDEDFCCGLQSPDMAKNQNARRPHNRGTLTVNVNVLLLSLASPDESSLKYEVEFLLNQQWNDPRLQYGNKSHYDFLNALHHHDSIWTPDTYFIMHGDFKDPIIPMHFALRIFRNGTITYAMRRHLILSCQGSLHIFPFDDPKCSFSMESISYEEAQIKYVWKNDEDTLRKSPSLTTLNAYLIKNQTTACDQNSWRGNYSCLRVDLIFTRDRAFYFTTVFIPGIILVTSSFITFWLEWNAVPARSMIGNYSCLQVELTFTRDRAYYFTTVFIPGIILVTSSFITFWLEWNAVPARVMIGVTTMLNFFTTSNGFRSTLPVVSNLTAMNVWDGVCMCFIYASLLEFVCVNYVGRKRPLHNVVYRPGENPVTQRLPAVLSRIGVILASPLDIIEREFHAALSSEKASAGASPVLAATPLSPGTPTSSLAMSATSRLNDDVGSMGGGMRWQEAHGGIIGAAVQNLRARSIKRKNISTSAVSSEHVYAEPIELIMQTSPTTRVKFKDEQLETEQEIGKEILEGSKLRRSVATSTPALVVRIDPQAQDMEMNERQLVSLPLKPPRKKPSRSNSPASVYAECIGIEDIPMAALPAEGIEDQKVGEKRRDAGAPNEIVACTTCGGSNSPCTHSANNGCATEVRKKEPPHPIRVAKTIDVIARITFPTAYAIFLIFFFVHYKGFS